MEVDRGGGVDREVEFHVEERIRAVAEEPVAPDRVVVVPHVFFIEGEGPGLEGESPVGDVEITGGRRPVDGPAEVDVGVQAGWAREAVELGVCAGVGR
jgi:hypothetical protein